MDSRASVAEDLRDLVARLWTGGADGRDRVKALLSAIEVVAPAAVDQAHARRVARQLDLLRREGPPGRR